MIIFLPSIWLSKLLLDLWDSIKTNTITMGVLEEKRGRGRKNIRGNNGQKLP